MHGIWIWLCVPLGNATSINSIALLEFTEWDLEDSIWAIIVLNISSSFLGTEKTPPVDDEICLKENTSPAWETIDTRISRFFKLEKFGASVSKLDGLDVNMYSSFEINLGNLLNNEVDKVIIVEMENSPHGSGKDMNESFSKIISKCTGKISIDIWFPIQAWNYCNFCKSIIPIYKSQDVFQKCFVKTFWNVLIFISIIPTHRHVKC